MNIILWYRTVPTSRFISLALLLAASSHVNGGIITATDFGNYIDDGGGQDGSVSYTVGIGGGITGRNFAVFDTSAYSSISSAVLRAYLQPPGNASPLGTAGGYLSPDPSETWTLYEVTTPTAVLSAGAGGVSTYVDLGTGVTYGSATVTDADEGSYVNVVLNGAALSSLNTATGNWAIGGALTSLGGGFLEILFLDSGGDLRVELEVEGVSIPVPATPLLLITALTLLNLRRPRIT